MNTVLNVKIDPVLKKRAQSTAKALGLPMSIVVAASLRDFVNTRTITISDSPKLKPEIETELLAMSANAKADNFDDYSPAFENLETSFKWLDTK